MGENDLLRWLEEHQECPDCNGRNVNPVNGEYVAITVERNEDLDNHPEITDLFNGGTGIFTEGDMRWAMYMKLTNNLNPTSEKWDKGVRRMPNGSSKINKWKSYTFYRHANYGSEETSLIILHTPIPKEDGREHRWIIYNTAKKRPVYGVKWRESWCEIQREGPTGLPFDVIDVSVESHKSWFSCERQLSTPGHREYGFKNVYHDDDEPLAVNFTEKERQCMLQNAASCHFCDERECNDKKTDHCGQTCYFHVNCEKIPSNSKRKRTCSCGHIGPKPEKESDDG